MDFDRYIEVFNTGDDDALVDGWFTDDIVYIGGNRTLKGKEAWLGFLKFAHDGVREIFHPQNVFQKEDGVFCEVDMDFHAIRPRPDYPLGPLYPGDRMTVKFFVVYKVRDGRFCQLKAATWPVNHGVSKIQRLGGSHPGHEAARRSYNAAFNAHDYERFGTFYTDDVVLEMGDTPPIHGRDAVLSYYRTFFGRVDEDVQETAVNATDDIISIETNVHYTVKQDLPDFPFGALRQNQSRDLKLSTVYNLRDGLISRIRIIPVSR